MSNKMDAARHAGIGLVLLAAGLTGCGPRGGIQQSGEGPGPDELVAFYSPQRIEIQPFTKPCSFDDDAIPDGVGVYVEPRDAEGDAVKAYGEFIFDLYEYRKASSDNRGSLLRQWRLAVNQPEDQARFWDRVTRMYNFQLSWDDQPLRPQQRYVLEASLQAPGGQRLFDRYEFEFRISREDILTAIQQGG